MNTCITSFVGGGGGAGGSGSVGYNGDAFYSPTVTVHNYERQALPLPVPFCWGPNGSLILLLTMETPMIVAGLIWRLLQ